MFHQHLHDVIALLLILVDHVDGLIIIGHRVCCHQGAILRQHDGREQLFYLLLYLVHIDITHHDDSLVVRTVPLLVISLQEGTLEVVDNLHQTDRHAVTVL